VGKSIDEPSLKAAGLQVKIVDPKDSKVGGRGANTPTLIVEVSGSSDALQKMAVLDSAGQSVSDESMTMMNTTQFTLNKPLDDAMKLQFDVAVGQKTVTAPFEIKDIELP
jgi:hypothetical protein